MPYREQLAVSDVGVVFPVCFGYKKEFALYALYNFFVFRFRSSRSIDRPQSRFPYIPGTSVILGNSAMYAAEYIGVHLDADSPGTIAAIS